MTLLEECIEALGSKVIVLNECDSNNIFELFLASVSFKWGRIDWDALQNKYEILSERDLESYLTHKNCRAEDEVFIIWDNANLPVIRSELKKIVSVLDDVLAVSFDTWIFCSSSKYIIEFTHDDVITLGTLE